MDNYIIKITDYTKEFKENIPLKNINLKLAKGKIYAFIGHNGSGKSMLFKAICGFIKPTKGTVEICGKIIGKDIYFPDNVGVLIENCGFIPNLTAVENLNILAQIQNKITIQDIKNTLELVGLDPENKKSVKKYSLGMKQKLAIAQAIMEKQEIIILDEPMNGLDRDSVLNIRNLLLNLKSEGKTILLASHNENDIVFLADEIFELNAGTLIEKQRDVSVSDG